MTLKVFLLLLATTVAVLQAQGKEDEMKASNQEVVEESESLMAMILKKNEHLEEIILAMSKKMEAQEKEIEVLQRLEIRVAAVEETVVPEFSTGNDDLDELEKKLTKKIHDTEDFLMQEISHGDRTVQDRLEETVETIEDSLQAEISGLQVSLEDVEEEISNLELTESAHCGYQDNVNWPNKGDGLSGSTIIYDRIYEEANTAGSNLDGSSGYFTAGKKGTYLVTLSADHGYTGDAEEFRVYLRTSSGKYQDDVEDWFASQRSFGTTSLWTTLSAARLVSISAGETVHLEYTCNGKCDIGVLKFCVALIN